MFNTFFLLVHVQLTINHGCTFPKHLKKEYLLQQKKLKFIKTIYLLNFFMLIFPLVDLSVKFLQNKKKME